MDLILLEKLTDELVQQGWKKDESRNMLLALNLMILKYGYEIVLRSQAAIFASSGTDIEWKLNKLQLVPPWASPTEKGIFCIGCKQTFADVPAFRAHLIPEEGKCIGVKPEAKPEPRYGCYD